MDVYHIAGDKGTYKGNDGLGAYALLPGSMDRAEHIGKMLDNMVFVPGRRAEHSAWLGDYKGVRVVSISSGMGVGSVDIVVRELIDLGVRRILRIGTCGAMQKQVRIGDICIAEGAIPDEDVSEKYHDWKDVYPTAHPDSVRACVGAAKLLGFGYHVGLYHTKSTLEREIGRGPFSGEHEAYMKDLNDLGVIASEMEASVLFTLAYVLVEDGLRDGIDDPKEVRAGAACLSLSGFDPDSDKVLPFSGEAKRREFEPRIVDLGLEAAVQWYKLDQNS